MTHGERYIEALTFGRPDRFPHWFMFGLMPGVRDRWVSEGMPESVKERDIPSNFGFDPKPVGIRVNTGMIPAPVWKVVEDTDERRIAVNDLGGKVMRVKWASTLDHALEYPVKTREDWEAIKDRFTYSPDRFASDWLDHYHQTRERGMAISASGGGGYGFPRRFHDFPRLMRVPCIHVEEEILLVMPFDPAFSRGAGHRSTVIFLIAALIVSIRAVGSLAPDPSEVMKAPVISIATLYEERRIHNGHCPVFGVGHKLRQDNLIQRHRRPPQVGKREFAGVNIRAHGHRRKRCTIRFVKHDALLREAIEVRSMDLFVAIAPQMIPSHGVRYDYDYVHGEILSAKLIS